MSVLIYGITTEEIVTHRPGSFPLIDVEATVDFNYFGENKKATARSLERSLAIGRAIAQVPGIEYKDLSRRIVDERESNRVTDANSSTAAANAG